MQIVSKSGCDAIAFPLFNHKITYSISCLLVLVQPSNFYADCSVICVITVIYHNMDISSGSRILVELLMFTQNCGNFSSKTGRRYHIISCFSRMKIDDHYSLIMMILYLVFGTIICVSVLWKISLIFVKGFLLLLIHIYLHFLK